MWRLYQSNTQSTVSDFASHIFRRGRTFDIYPTPSSSSNTITIIYEPFDKDLINADYTTGTITTLANDGTAVTGSGSTWTSSMVGRFFKINADGQWYQISAVGSTTSITLVKNYQGSAIAAGSEAYTIGEMANIPPNTYHLPPVYAAYKYFNFYKKDLVTGNRYKADWLDELAIARERLTKRYTTKYIPSQRRMRKTAGLQNPNWFPSGLN